MKSASLQYLTAEESWHSETHALSHLTRAGIIYWLKRAVVLVMSCGRPLQVKAGSYFARLWNNIMRQNPLERWNVYWQMLNFHCPCASYESIKQSTPPSLPPTHTHTHLPYFLTFLMLLLQNHTFCSNYIAFPKNCLIKMVGKSQSGRRWRGEGGMRVISKSSPALLYFTSSIPPFSHY